MRLMMGFPDCRPLLRPSAQATPMHLQRQQPLPLHQVGACWPRCTLVHCQVFHLKALLPLSSLPQLESAPSAGQTSAFARAAAQANAQVLCVHVLHPLLATSWTHTAFKLRSVKLLTLPCTCNPGWLLKCCPLAVPHPDLLMGLSDGFSRSLCRQRSYKRRGPGTMFAS